MRGIVEMYDQQKKFGFIECIGEKHGKMVTCNRVDIVNADALEKNQLVDFTLGEGDRAKNIFVISKEI